MNKKMLVASLSMAVVMGFSATAHAVPSVTPWNNVWLSLSLSATLPAKKGIDGDGSGLAANNRLNKTAQKHKSGPCVMYITDSGVDSYHERIFCNVSADTWEYVSHYYGIETADKTTNTIGSHDMFIYTPEQGQSIATASKFMNYRGTLLLTAKLDASGKIKSVSSSGNRGGFYLGNSTEYIFGTTPTGALTLKLAKEADITAGLTACLASVDGGTPVPNCNPDIY